MRSSRRLAALVAGLALTGASLSACGDSEGGGAAKGNGLENGGRLTIAALPLVDAAALHVADKAGLFRAEGLTVRIQPVQQSIQALPALKKGDVDVIAGANYVTFLKANEEGALKLRVLQEGATLTPNLMNVVVRPDSPIKRPKDLEGRTVAVNILNNIQGLTLDAILRAQKVDPAKVRYKQIPFPQMATALGKGDVDAVHVVEPFLADARKKLGARVVVDGGGAPVTDLPISGYVSTEAFTTRNPRLAAAFQRVMAKAQAMAGGDRRKVEEVLPGYARIQPDVARAITLPGFPVSNDATRLTRVADLMVDARLLKARPDLKSLLFTPQP